MCRYWEAKLPPSHIPSDSKMENFIRTKYSSRRWVYSPNLPDDPSILDDLPADDQESDQEVPLAVVKQTLQKTPPRPPRSTQLKPPSHHNLLGNDTPPTSSKTSEIPPIRTESPSPKPRVVSNQALLGIEFDSPVRTQSAPIPSTTGANVLGRSSSIATSRIDLKNSILSLYAPKPSTTLTPITSPPLTSPTPTTSSAFGDLSSLTMSPQPKPAATSISNPLNDLSSAFGGLSIPSSTTQNRSQSQVPSTASSPGLKQSPFSFGQTTMKSPPPPPPQPTNPSTFTIPLPSAPTKSTITSTFNLSNAPTQQKTSPSLTATSTITTKPSGIQLLSSLTPTSSSSTPAAPPPPQITNTYSNPWAAPPNPPTSTATSTSTNPSLNVFNDPWSTEVKDPSPSSFPAQSAPSTIPTRGGTVAGFGSGLSDTGGSIWGSKTANGTNSGGALSAVSGATWGKTSLGDSPGEEKKNLDDGFGLFETADVWK